MILYLLKSAACLLILLLVHQFLLQRESMHRFNRFFLLFSIVVSFLIPIYIIEVAAIPVVEESRKFEIFENVVQSEFPETNINSESIPIAKDLDFQEKNSIPWTVIFWSVYLSITLVFLIRFVRNIHILADKISRNLHVSYRGETLVLLAEKSLPFTFLKYIFVSKTYFEEGKLTEAIFAHERAHLQEKHSLDLLFIELLLIFFWFHPGLYFARQAIKLNHEFIADQAALRATTLEQYQSQLLSMMVSGQNYKLASSLNFSLTKKRFEMMRRKTTNTTKWIKMFFVLPVLTAMVYIFSEKVTAQAEDENNEKVARVIEETAPVDKKETYILLRTDGKIEVDGQIMEVEQLAELIDSENSENMTVGISGHPDVKMGFVADVQKILRDKNIRRVVYQSRHDQEIGSILHPVPTSQDDRQTTLAEFKELNGVYQVKLNQKGPFAKKSDLEIKQLLDMFTSLQEKYTGLSYEDKRIIQRPSFPYARLEKDGKMIFKRFEDLTEEERKTLNC